MRKAAPAVEHLGSPGRAGTTAVTATAAGRVAAAERARSALHRGIVRGAGLADGDALDDRREGDLAGGVVLLDLMVDLRAHAAGDGAGEQVGDTVDDLRGLAERVDEDGEDVEDARDELREQKVSGG